MSAVWMRLRAEFRARWRSWLVLSVLLGAFGGASIAAAAGARRTDTAYPRFVVTHKAFDVVIGGVSGDVEDRAEQIFRDIERLPQVADSCSGTPFVAGRVITSSGRTLTFPNVFVTAQSACERRLNTPKLLSGRLADPRRVDEAVVTFAVAERLGLRVGSVVTIPMGELDPRLQVVPVKVRIVGIKAAPGEFPSVSGGSFPSLDLTPAFLRRYQALVTPELEGPSLRLRGGAKDIPAFLAAMQRRNLNADVPFQLPDHVAGVQRSIRFEAIALWLLATLTAATALAVLGQALARQAFMESSEHPVLRALGMSRSQLFLAGLVRNGAIAAAGAAVAVLIAIALSPLTPIGLARIAEPSPGLSVDGTALAIGAAAVLVLSVAVSAWPAWRAARVIAADADSASASAGQRPSAIAGVLARGGASASAVTGVRLALERGRGRTAVPIRTTIAGTAIALAALTLATSFSASLDRLIETPSLSGYTWDGILVFEGPEPTRAALATLQNDQEIRQIGVGGGLDVEVGGVRRVTMTFDARSPIQPAIAEGRRPLAGNEIALGSRTLRSIGAHVGDTIDVRTAPDEEEGIKGGPLTPMRVVGRAVIPQFFFQIVQPGDGVFLTLDGARRLGETGPSVEDALFVRFAPGVDPDTKLAALGRTLHGVFPVPGREPADLASLSRISGVPVVLAIVLAAMAVAILAHTLVTAIRRRRRDLAILKTLGFVRRQVGAAVAWQATAILLLALVVGLPVGIAAGRWTWRLFADNLAVVPEPVVPALAIALVVPAGLLLANIVAALPGRAAARTRPALVLRTE